MLELVKMIESICHSILKNSWDAEDAAQEARLAIWQKQHQLQDKKKLKSWSAVIAKNKALECYRKRKKGGSGK